MILKRNAQKSWLIALAPVFSIAISHAQGPDPVFRPAIPKMWDDAEMSALELPLADAVASPKHVTADYYYKIPVRPIYKQYPVYRPGSRPAGYIEWLRRQEPENVWGEDRNGHKHAPPLKTEADWIRAREIVFDSVLGSLPLSDTELAGMGEYIAKRGIPLAHDESIAIFDFRVLEKGKIEMGTGSCKSCHARVMPEGIPAKGFKVPELHKSRYDVLPVVVGTDLHLTMETRRGTGDYKVPSLRGLWYRGPLEHSGSVATLEDWFDPKRLRDDYVPTGFKGYGLKARAVPGHEFGLELATEDKKALIAFLKTL